MNVRGTLQARNLIQMHTHVCSQLLVSICINRRKMCTMFLLDCIENEKRAEIL